MNTSGIILLTSTGLSAKRVYEKFSETVGLRSLSKVIIITTASSDKEKNKYSQLAFDQLKSVGLETIDFFDFEFDKPKDISLYDIIYVCGGNTFKLMKFARQSNFGKEIKSLLKRGGMYIGVSAGSLIIGPSIKIAAEIHPDLNEVGVADFSGFNIVDPVIFPHYSVEVEEEIKAFENKNNIQVVRLSNSHALLIENGEEVVI